MKNRVNQQGTLPLSDDFKTGWLVAAIESEGTLTISKGSSRYGNHWRPMIRIDNTKIKYIERAANFASDLGIAQYIRHSYPRRGNHKAIHAMFIYGVKRVHNALAILLPYFCSKAELAELVYEACNLRLSHPMTYRNQSRGWEQEELNIISKIRLLNQRGIGGDSSTTNEWDSGDNPPKI